MVILLIIFVVMLSVAIFFYVATKLGSAKDKTDDILDLDAIPRSREKEAKPMLRDDDDQYV